MKRKLIKSFFKDFLIDSIAYCSACFLIGLFYYIDTGKQIEVIYPFTLALFVYLVWMAIRFTGYCRIYNSLENLKWYQDTESNYSNCLNRKITVTMNEIHDSYLDRLSEEEESRKKERRFLSMWVHNMKTPVTVTDLLLQRIKQGEVELLSASDTLMDENKKLLTNLDAVLNILRLEEFAKDYVPEQIDLLEALKSIINKNKSIFIYNHVFPKIISKLKRADILSDSKWNDLMISQLISNAVKYSKGEEGTMVELFFLVEQEADRVILTIRDQGIGIPSHDLCKVFEPFFTGDNGRKGYSSSGIGLYFCKEVCKRLGHTIDISSEVGKGTEVRITYLAKL